MFYELTQTCPSSLCTLSLYPPSSDREAWGNADPVWKEGTLTLGRSYLNYNYPQLTAADYMDFTLTGNRVRFEDKCFARRHALNALVLSECVADTGEFMTDIVNGIFCICEESAWQLPAHNSYIRDTPQLPLPDSANPVLDLFACETGSILAAVSYLLGEKLDTISPLIRKRIFQELTCRIFRPYLEKLFWWMGDGKESLNNWTVWCTQNVLLCVFLTDTDNELRSKVVAKACQSVDYFLDGYGEDGCCDEGAQYYRHAGLCLFNILEILNAVTGNHFSRLYQDPKIQNIAAYICNVHVQGKYYVNFADCSPVAGRCSAREYLFACRTGNENMMAFAAKDLLEGEPETLLLPTENNLYYRLQHAFTLAEIRTFISQNPPLVHYSDIYYPTVGLFIARDETLFLAVKAGSNGDSHNHNDTGSFTVYKNGLPLLVDVGVESYTKKTFSPQRYEIWTMQSAYHNLPTINGWMQKDGKDYGARNTTTAFSDSCCQIRTDIAGAYPSEAHLDSYIREASLVKGKEIQIKDSFRFSDDPSGQNEVILSFMTYEKPTLHDQGGLLSFQIGQLGSFSISGTELVKIEAIPITDKRLQTAWDHELYRILVTATGSEVEMQIC